MCNFLEFFSRDNPQIAILRRGYGAFPTHSALVRALRTLQMKTCYFALQTCMKMSQMCNFIVDFFDNFFLGGDFILGPYPSALRDRYRDISRTPKYFNSTTLLGPSNKAVHKGPHKPSYATECNMR